MKREITTILFLVIYINMTYGLQKENFAKDSIILQKESMKLFKKSDFFDKNENYIIKFLYYFDLGNNINIKDTVNNNYMKSLLPKFTYRHYYTLLLPIPRKKRLIAPGFVFNSKDSLVCKICSFSLYPFILNSQSLPIYFDCLIN